MQEEDKIKTDDMLCEANEKPHKLLIYRRYFYNSDCYKSATTHIPRGVQVHSTGANNPWLKRYVQPDDGRIGVNVNGNSHNRPGGNVCASAYIGKQSNGNVAVYQALPWEYRCWLSGSGSNGNANKLGYVGYEICEDALSDPEYFRLAMEQAILLTAHLCLKYGIDPDNAVFDHRELHDKGLASNHGDITLWLRKFGKDMNQFRDEIKRAMDDGIDAVYIDCDEVKIMYKAKAVNPGSYLNLRAGQGTNYKVLAKIPQGAVVSVIDDSNPEWWNVTYDGTTGYAMAVYLEKIKENNEEKTELPNDDEADIRNVVEIPMELAEKLYDILKNQLG